MQVKIVQLLLASLCLLVACQGHVIREDELLEKPVSEFLEPMVWLPESEIKPNEELEEPEKYQQEPEIFPEIPLEAEIEIQPRSGEFENIF